MDSPLEITTPGCLETPQPKKRLQITWEEAESNGLDPQEVSSVLQGIRSFLLGPAQCSSTTVFSLYNGTNSGAFSGGLVDNRRTTATMVDLLAEVLESASQSLSSLPSRVALQLCNWGIRGDHVAGVVVHSGALESSVDAVQNWSNGECILYGEGKHGNLLEIETDDWEAPYESRPDTFVAMGNKHYKPCEGSEGNKARGDDGGLPMILKCLGLS
ncbi:hypothetical protein F4778DRAFT_799857 [Xylariomycetidae sp. FL2044]|nr:hypothetical protein F4778DRAFT_799857 [Xylariomycetidae sp. FL2044]